ncbi:MAG TPA: hypothetical protein VI588_02405, partial [Candidatus Gracilibacteria bacterium]|nr:hypothetical protein [Candidatus Gracilibacteria bacterium]
ESWTPASRVEHANLGAVRKIRTLVPRLSSSEIRQAVQGWCIKVDPDAVGTPRQPIGALPWDDLLAILKNSAPDLSFMRENCPSFDEHTIKMEKGLIVDAPEQAAEPEPAGHLLHANDAESAAERVEVSRVVAHRARGIYGRAASSNPPTTTAPPKTRASGQGGE